jgi:TatD DNase family protein
MSALRLSILVTQFKFKFVTQLTAISAVLEILICTRNLVLWNLPITSIPFAKVHSAQGISTREILTIESCTQLIQSTAANFNLSTLSYLDIHTHGRLEMDSAVCVASLSIEEIRLEQTTKEYSSAGIHPWWLEDHSAEEINKLKAHIENMAQAGRLWGIGETGFDRSYPEFMDQQKELFQWHLDLSENHKLPLVIHNVRSGSDFLEVLKKKKPGMPWIFHDFRGNEELMKSLLSLHSNCFFSFGLSLDNSQNVRELLSIVPMENIFLETDNQKHLDIHDIYLRAAESLKVDVEFLKSQIWHNFKKLTPLIQ